ncbi:D-amino-acid transaminase [Fervidibacillus halotolerans]|uniref:D-alanine aminotransferase n=1 Tax=Fervidibacillus halotolerans TaxID=2980027 RepID=A0A9E8RZL5_9BACI|nr:D-amino-acid transaminase [Fervidibacillus halotolerans]WAA11762.1 D-amino-acid transaminase [Fervidibacillus halotolerans]
MAYMFLNGKLIERTKGKIDVEDRGFQFGDGIYEVIAVYGGRPFALSDHLDRLFESAKKIYMEIPYSKKELEDGIHRLLHVDKREHCYIYIQVSRGISPRNHIIPQRISGTVIIYLLDPIREKENWKRRGIKAAITEDIRWLRCDIKTTSLLGNVLVKQKAVEKQASEAILHREQRVTEGSSSNVWIVKDGLLRTHPADQFILNGITRKQILAISKQQRIPYVEQSFTVDELLGADEVFITSTTMEVTPVVEVDEVKINEGKPGLLTKKLQWLLEREIQSQCFDDASPFSLK